MSRRTAHWAIAFLIGLATVTATGFGWRAAQIGSTAAFDDRQSISETIRVEQQEVQRTITLAADVREYARYRADYRVAAALDARAARLAARGAAAEARAERADATAVREGATRRAAAAGVFGRFTIADDLLRPTPRPRSFDVRTAARALAADQATALDSPGALDPGRWARAAEAIRDRTRRLSGWALVVLVAVLLYTVAEVSQRRRRMYAFAGGGLVIYLVGLVGGLATVF